MKIRFVQTSNLAFVLFSIFLGIVLLVSMLVVSIVLHPVPPDARLAVRVLLAVGAGFVSAGLLGSLEFDSTQSKLGIVASGGFGVFALVYLVEPGIISVLGLG